MSHLARAACLALALTVPAGAASAQSDFVPPKNAHPFTDKPIRADAGSFHFAIVSDRTGGARPGVFESAIGDLNLLGPAFVINIGDLVEGYTSDKAVLDREWRDLDAIVDRLSMRFFYVPGNHDLSNPVMVDFWRKRMGNPYYSFRYRDVLFLALDTEDPPPGADALKRLFPEPGRAEEIGRLLKTNPKQANDEIAKRLHAMNVSVESLTPPEISDAQVDWARKTLAANRDVKWTFVFMHKPAWHYDSKNFQAIQAALKGRRYTVFAGHEHYYRHDRIDGHDYIQLATTGGEQIRQGPGAVDQIAWVGVGGGAPSIVNIRLDGMFPASGPAGLTAAPPAKK